LLCQRFYRGEAVLKLSQEIISDVRVKGALTASEIEDIFAKLDSEGLYTIFHKTHPSVVDVRVKVLKGLQDQFKVTVESKRIDELPISLEELIEYIRNSPVMKTSVDSNREILQRRLEELSRTIESSKQISVN